jgi:hypothetical protein
MRLSFLNSAWRPAAAVLLAALVSCSDGRAVVEDRGPLLAGDVAISSSVAFVWLPGGAEIAYVSATSELVAVRLADGASRQLDPAKPYFATGLARSGDGNALYFLAQDLSGAIPRFTLHEAFTHAEVGVGELVLGNPAVSPDGRRVLYWTTSGASVLDASGAIFFVPTCASFAILPVFSPAGDQLLCGFEPPILVNVADGSTQALPENDSSLWRAVRWNGGGPQAVALIADARGEHVDLVDVTSGEVRALYQPARSLLDFAEAAISADGRSVAFWETECLHSASLLSCEAGQTEARLKVVDVSSGRAATVASSAAGPGPIAFSDDGTRIAYAFWAGTAAALHVRAVP